MCACVNKKIVITCPCVKYFCCLDPLTQREVMDFLTDLARENGIAVLLVSHDPDLIANSTDRQISLTPA